MSYNSRLFREKEKVDAVLVQLMDDEMARVVDTLLQGNEAFLRTWQQEQATIRQETLALKQRSQKKDEPAIRLDIDEGPVLTSGDIDLGIFGYEIPLWLAENMRDMWKILFPQMVVKTNSTNKIMKLGGLEGLGQRSVGMFISKSGATFPTKGALELLKRVMPGNIFAMTGRIDTLLGMSLGQKLMPDAPFSRRIFVTGRYFPAEASTVAEASLHAHMVNLVLEAAKEMKAIFPKSRPWGLSLEEKDLADLAHLRVGMVAEAESLTGRSADGRAVVSGVYQQLQMNARSLGKTIAETPLVSNIFMRAFVLGIFWFGAPVDNIVQWLAPYWYPGFSGIGAAFSGPLAFAVHTSDFLITMFMGWFATTYLYRQFFSGRSIYARLGRPTMVIGDMPMLHQTTEQLVSKLSALALGSMDVDVHGGNPRDHFVARFGHRIRRGTLLFFGLPAQKEAADETRRAMKQAKGVVNSILPGWLSRYFPNTGIGGAEVYSLGRGELNDLDASDHHINLGEQKALQGASALVERFNAVSFDPFGRMIAYKVLFNEAFRWATTWKLGGFVWQAWNQAWTYSRTGVHTTASPVIGVARQFSDWLARVVHKPLSLGIEDQLQATVGRGEASREAVRQGAHVPDREPPLKAQVVVTDTLLKGEYVVSAADQAPSELPRDGGINLTGRWLEPRLNAQGQTQVFFKDHPLESLPVQGIILQRIELHPVEINSVLMRLGALPRSPALSVASVKMFQRFVLSA
ncbi:MAG: hypothetical protein V2A70_05765 [Candidatus Omnitrophota bacterium]